MSILHVINFPHQNQLFDVYNSFPIIFLCCIFENMALHLHHEKCFLGILYVIWPQAGSIYSCSYLEKPELKHNGSDVSNIFIVTALVFLLLALAYYY